jgi:hypothetical protein
MLLGAELHVHTDHKTSLMLLIHPSDASAGSPMLMNMGQMSFQILSQGFRAMMRAHP